MMFGFKIYVVGTKSNPTEYLMRSGELTPFLKEATFYTERKEAEQEIQECDEPELFQVYEANVAFEGGLVNL